jgi:DNA polymerase I
MKQKQLAHEKCEVYTLLGRSRRFPNMAHATSGQRGHIERAAINAPVQVITVYCNSLLKSILR